MSERTRARIQRELGNEFDTVSELISSLRKDESGKIDLDEVKRTNSATIGIFEHIQGIANTGKLTETETEEMKKMAYKISNLLVEKAKELGRETETKATSDERIARIENDYEKMFEAEAGTQVRLAETVRRLENQKELGEVRGYGELQKKTSALDERVKVITFILNGKERKMERHRNKNGDVGGFVEETASAGEDTYIGKDALILDSARVYCSALVRDNAQISGNARVSGDAQIYDKARVFGDASISDNARVFGDAWVSCDARVSDNARVFGDVWVSGSTQISDNDNRIKPSYLEILRYEAADEKRKRNQKAYEKYMRDMEYWKNSSESTFVLMPTPPQYEY
ncbi:MAG: hypothetical protein ABSD68_00705 [Candidatus Micrarchaeales archaeon]